MYNRHRHHHHHHYHHHHHSISFRSYFRAKHSHSIHQFPTPRSSHPSVVLRSGLHGAFLPALLVQGTLATRRPGAKMAISIIFIEYLD